MAEFNINPMAHPPIGVPIGTILPYVGPLAALPAEWHDCDGSLLVDPASQFHNQHLPNFDAGVYMMGTGDPNLVNVQAGSNVLNADGLHNHTGGTSDANIGGFVPGHAFQAVNGPNLQDHTHSLNISGNGQHTHNGGDNRPLSLGVHFIIRVK